MTLKKKEEGAKLVNCTVVHKHQNKKEILTAITILFATVDLMVVTFTTLLIHCCCCCCCSVTKLCPTLRVPEDCTMPGSSVLRYLLEFAQIHVH